ncbi:LytTR family DNA-binding domain-containing protein [Brevundimonas variabilis]|uniref:HTH LytTR-type domain-containing protein n=1 Tax=Brevundimonas variabilis TaxID=74312 RepID=A0A7W9CJT6_9CAUL|nr:LytTR family DNA-binding domain-containing protein [Brevundimonas variabilis]MBB5746851.1 hypothetical protein [Brevundimonas variabilis]
MAFATEWNTPRAWAIDLGVCAVVGGLLGILGPFGSYLNEGAAMRILYWVGVFMVSGAVHGIVIRKMLRPAARAQIPVWVWLPGVVLVLNLPLSTLSRLTAIAIWPELEQAVRPLEWFVQSLVIALAYASAFYFLRFRPGRVIVAPAVEGHRSGTLRIRDDLLCLQMEDHYVRVHTPDGSRLVLMPLSQAVTEVAGIEGLRIHRSWWVARSAVAAVRSEGRNFRLVLTNGIEAPVARSAVSTLRAAGWLDDPNRGRNER